VERSAGYDERIVHGEAVGLGLSLAFRLSAALGLCPPGDAERVARHLAAVGLPTGFADIPIPMTAAGLVEAMAQDKKVKDGVLRFVLVNRIGEAFLSTGVEPAALAAFLAHEGLPPS
jgi:3-dehydroquinate synthetase